MPYEIFRAGTRTDNNGNTVSISADDVAAIAAHYDKAKHEAPIVVGHPAANAPAFGWVSALRADNGVLYAEFAEVDEDFAELVRKGRYKKVSASFYPPKHPSNPNPNGFYLRHVGFLGAHPPAVKGLKNIDFADDDNSVISFCEICEENKENLMTTEEQLAAEKAAREKAEQEAANAKAELAKLQAEQEQALRDADHAKNVDFAEGLVKAGSLKPADKDLIVQVLDFAEHPEHVTADFGEGKSLADALKAFLQNGTTILPAGETATAKRADKKDVSGSLNFAEYADPEAQNHHERALALAAKENISYEEAARRTVQ